MPRGWRNKLQVTKPQVEYLRDLIMNDLEETDLTSQKKRHGE